MDKPDIPTFVDMLNDHSHTIYAGSKIVTKADYDGFMITITYDNGDPWTANAYTIFWHALRNWDYKSDLGKICIRGATIDKYAARRSLKSRL